MAAGAARATVLAASADASVCEVLARIAEAAGHEAVRVTDVAQVVTGAATAAADAVVLDLGAESLAVLTELRAQLDPAAATTRVVVLGTGPANARLAWQAGADAVLTRPFAATELQAELAASLGRSDGDRQALRTTAAAALAP